MPAPLQADERQDPKVAALRALKQRGAKQPDAASDAQQKEGSVVIPLRQVAGEDRDTSAHQGRGAPPQKTIPVVRIPPRPKKPAVPEALPRSKPLLPDDRTSPSAFPTRPKLAAYDPKWDSRPASGGGASTAQPKGWAGAPAGKGSSLEMRPAAMRSASAGMVKPVIRRKYVRADAPPRVARRPVHAMPRQQQKLLIALHVGPWVAFSW